MRMWTIMLTASVALTGPAMAETMPRLQRNGQATHLMVDDKPYLGMAGELHNSSPSSPTYMAPIWDKLSRAGVRTVIGAASWELVEPREGQFDFTTVDDQIRQARAHGMRLVLIWFGGYKNASSTYAPSWVRRDERRFPRTMRDPAAKPTGLAQKLSGLAHVSVFSDALVDADARAFAALMAHIRKIDTDRTVVMMQVENEVGLLGDSRDRSPLAEAQWNAPVPAPLMRYLETHKATLRPHLRETWERNGARKSGSWAQVFGSDKAADEIFMAWAFANYVEKVTRAGAAQYNLPMFANAWLGPQPNAPQPGNYPSGGPVARMMDIWKAGAPSIALLAPDIYVQDFAGVLKDFSAPNNPILVPEARNDPGNLFIALGQYNAIAFSPFGIEDLEDDSPMFQAYKVLNGLSDQITLAQAKGRIRGFKIPRGGEIKESLAGYDFDISSPQSTAGAFGAGTGTDATSVGDGYGLIINTAPDEFLIVGRGATISFAATDAHVEVDWAKEWDPKAQGRVLNGDERFYLISSADVRAIEVKLLKRQGR